MITTAETSTGGVGLAAELVSLSAGLMSLSSGLARAIEAGDLETAERLIDDRGHILDRVLEVGPPAGRAAPELAAAAHQAAEEDGRSHASLSRHIAGIREALATLAKGVTAVRAYGSPEALAPGFVDSRD
jgi:hypothetical protein